MLRTKEYIINIPPIPWKRPGLNGKHFFDRQDHEKLACGLYLNQQHGDAPMFCRPLHMELTFYMPIPRERKDRTPGMWDYKLPDIDNLQKFILDTITNTGVIWKDDRMVCSLIAKKIYDKNPRTHIVIKELE